MIRMSMTIHAPCVVSLSWRLEDAQDRLIDTLDEPAEFFYGGDDLLESVERAIEGQSAGFATRIQLEPEQAFGEYRPELVCFEDRSMFPAQLEPGMQFDGLPEGSASEGMPRDAIYTVTEVYPEHVVLDGNHPLAGMALRLSLQVTDVREASEEEIAQGSVGSDVIQVLGGLPPPGRLH
jgi:FKBP-type peptidyl-prolyl cis-trans isomerase SlyD